MSEHLNATARLLQHRSSPVVFDRRDPVVEDPYPPTSVVERAKAAMLCDRADALEVLSEEAQRDVLKVMDKPSYLELQAIDSRYVQTLADDAAMLLYARPLDKLDSKLQQTLRDNAAVFLRSRHQAWVCYAREMAVVALKELFAEDLHKALPHMSQKAWHGHAVRCADRVWGAMRNALASIDGIAPGVYLRLAGKSTAEEAGRS